MLFKSFEHLILKHWSMYFLKIFASIILRKLKFLILQNIYFYPLSKKYV